jgi:hypothetical protein
MPLAEKRMPGKGDSPCPRLSTTTREQYVVEFAVARETGIKSRLAANTSGTLRAVFLRCLRPSGRRSRLGGHRLDVHLQYVYELGSKYILTDGYFTRIPQSEFFGGGGSVAGTRHSFVPDV